MGSGSNGGSGNNNQGLDSYVIHVVCYGLPLQNSIPGGTHVSILEKHSHDLTLGSGVLGAGFVEACLARWAQSDMSSEHSRI